MRTKLFAGVAFAALMIPASAYAQSAASTEFDEGEEIVVTGSRVRGVGGIEISDTSKAKGTLNQEFISRQTPGQTILNTINQLPGVSFQNNDPYGSAGGTLTIRGFDSSRISLTFDGIPLNDTGNYAIYSNQQLDPELIEAASVNYGSTDVDSPTASASGSTVNYRTIVPTNEFGARLSASVGEHDMFRVFGLVNTGEFTKFGTKAWISASSQSYKWFANDFGKIEKQQYNGRIYQPLGSNGDFISIAANYNQNRNNFAGSLPLRLDANRVVGPNSSNRFPISNDELPYHVDRCTVPAGRPGIADAASSCGTVFDYRYNPSNTGSLRIQSRFTLATGLVLTVEPSFQYVKANGGGTATAREGLYAIGNGQSISGYFGGSPYAGHDLNGDGDMLDQVTVLAPSQTQTRRYGVIANLRYDIADGQTVRIGYTFDKGRHRQTGETGFLLPNGLGVDPFPVNNPILAASGAPLEKRDRLSYAMLNQVSGQYRGEFGALTIDAGFRMAFQQRDLNQHCFTSSSGGFVECFGDESLAAALAAQHPYVVNPATGAPTVQSGANAGWAPPQSRVYKYNKFLPSGGLTFKATDNITAFVSYSKGIQVPGTDNLYNAFYYVRDSEAANPVPETTDNFDAGIRYSSPNLQVQVGPWYTRFTNRLASAYNPETDKTDYRNLGRVDKYGVDGNIDWRPIPQVLVHAFGSYLWSDIKDDVATGQTSVALTAGKRESGAPVYTFGGRVQATLGPVDFAVQSKTTGPRYVNDQNLPIVVGGSTLYPAKTPVYTLVDLDARINLGKFLDMGGLSKNTYLQVNVMNLFDEYYVGGFSGGSLSTTSVPFVQVGVPRTVMGSINIAF